GAAAVAGYGNRGREGSVLLVSVRADDSEPPLSIGAYGPGRSMTVAPRDRSRVGGRAAGAAVGERGNYARERLAGRCPHHPAGGLEHDAVNVGSRGRRGVLESVIACICAGNGYAADRHRLAAAGVRVRKRRAGEVVVKRVTGNAVVGQGHGGRGCTV